MRIVDMITHVVEVYVSFSELHCKFLCELSLSLVVSHALNRFISWTSVQFSFFHRHLSNVDT